jgi:hypothetical protein
VAIPFERTRSHATKVASARAGYLSSTLLDEHAAAINATVLSP